MYAVYFLSLSLSLVLSTSYARQIVRNILHAIYAWVSAVYKYVCLSHCRRHSNNWNVSVLRWWRGSVSGEAPSHVECMIMCMNALRVYICVYITHMCMRTVCIRKYSRDDVCDLSWCHIQPAEAPRRPVPHSQTKNTQTIRLMWALPVFATAS